MSAKRLAVIGAGTMGAGIAVVAAVAGCSVQLVDRVEVHPAAKGRIEKSLAALLVRHRLSADQSAQAMGRISWSEEVSQLAATDLVVEAVAEDFELKRQVLLALRRDFLGLVATNTSSLSVSALAAFAPDPSRFLGLHFFNPPERMVLVEVVHGAQTSEQTMTEAEAFVSQIGKQAVRAQDAPGFIVNRVARPIYLEALRLVGDGAASVELVDRLIEGLGFPLGPFRLMDLIGIDVNLAVSESVYRQLMHEPRLRPHPLQQRMVNGGALGRKSGRGFYTYA